MTQKEILIIGAYHFMEESNIDHYSENSQMQIEKLVNNLSEFKPDKIAIEAPYQCQQSISKAYKSIELADFYKTNEMKTISIGQLEIQGNLYPIDYNNEAVQLGFRLGKKMKHTDVNAIDYLVEYNHDFELMNQFKSETLEKALILEENQKTFGAIMDEQRSFIDKIRLINNKDWSPSMNSLFYSSVLRVGAQKNYIGADKMVMWYERNIKILVNLLGLFENCDRVVCIIGAGHTSILKELINKYTNLIIVDNEPYIG